MIRYILKKKFHMAGKAFLIAFAFLLADGIAAHAMEPAQLQLTVYQEFTLTSADTLPEDGSTVTYELIPVSGKEAPLPGGASENYEFRIEGNHSLPLDRIQYTKAGIFEYTLKRTAPDKSEGYTYDNQEIKLIVQVTRYQENGVWGLKLDWVAQDESGEKLEKLVYSHAYAGDLEEPDNPNNPDEPDNPNEPDTPDNPNEPDTPDNPDEPDNPDKPDTPDNPGNTDNQDNSEAPSSMIEAFMGMLPKTGDGSQTLFYAALIAVVAVAFAILRYLNRKKK